MLEQHKLCIEYFNYLIFDKLIINNLNCWIAGGAVRDYYSLGYITSDIDIYFPNQDEFNKAFYQFDYLKARLIYENEKIAIWLYNNKKFELIKIYFSTPEETINAFDFTVCCCAVSFNNVYFHETFFIDLSKRRLVINKLPYPISTLQRLQKYIKKGYTICNGGILEIAKAINKIDLDDLKQNHIEFYPDGKPKFIRID